MTSHGYVTTRARPSKALERLKQPRTRSCSPTLADMAVFRVSDHRDAIQKATFTKWVNHHLSKANVTVGEMYEDFRDGVNLLLLLEILTEEKLPREKGNLRFHKLQNCRTVLNFLASKQVRLASINPSDIVDGNPKITMGLIWIIILHFQISDIKVILIGAVDEMTPKAKLLHWCRRITEGYPQVSVLNFTTSWKDGLAFNAIIHRYRPDLIDLSQIKPETPEHNVEKAFSVAQQELGVPRLLDVEDVTEHADEKSIMTYVSSLYDKFPRAVASLESSEDDEKLVRYKEYCTCTEELVAWIKRVMVQLESRTFPTTIQGMKDVIQDFDQFYTEEFTRIEESRNYAKAIAKELQILYGPMSSWLEFPKGCHPRDVEVLWIRLLRCIEERNKNLRSEMSRVRKTHQLADKVLLEVDEMEKLLPVLENKVDEEERVWSTMEKPVARERFRQLEVPLKSFEEKLYAIYKNFEYLVNGHYQSVEEIRVRIISIQARWKVLLMRLSNFDIEPAKHFMQFDAPAARLLSPEAERKTKADWAPEAGASGEKRPKLSSIKFPTITKVSKKTLQQQRVPATLDAPLTRTTVQSSQSTPPGKTTSYKMRRKSSKSRDPAQRLQEVETLLGSLNQRKNAVQISGYGEDLTSVEKHYNEHLKEHEDTMALRENVERVSNQTSIDDKAIKDKTTELKRVYSELVILSVQRTRYLRSLLNFMNEATKELIWMNQKEESETMRDWSDEDLDVEEIEQYRKEFQSELTMHENEQRSVVGKGEHLMQSGHPARSAIDAYVTSLHNQWNWITELYKTLEEHLLSAHAYHQFFHEAKEMESWLTVKESQVEAISVEENRSKTEFIALWKQLMCNAMHYQDLLVLRNLFVIVFVATGAPVLFFDTTWRPD